MEKIFLNKDINSLYHSNLSLDSVKQNDSIDVITIAFNNAKIIEVHNEWVAKYLIGNINHIVVDNSTNWEISLQIREVCEINKIPYVRLHKNRMGIFSGSYSHATAVNWVYHHIIKPRGAFGFGFIDHDLFPVSPIDLRHELENQPIYGVQRKRENLWYLSAILNFYRKDYVFGKKFDFMPVNIDDIYLDTGGGNWPSIYSNINEADTSFVSARDEIIYLGKDQEETLIELFDDDKWIHTINGSHWIKKDIAKEDYLSDLLVKYESPV